MKVDLLDKMDFSVLIKSNQLKTESFTSLKLKYQHFTGEKSLIF